MNDNHKRIRKFLEDWGAWRRSGIGAMGHKKTISAFDSANYQYFFPSKPNWNRKRPISEKEEYKFRQVKQVSTRSSFSSRVPFYMPCPKMNELDRKISALPKPTREIIELKFKYELKNSEIAIKLHRDVSVIQKRIVSAYKTLSQSGKKQAY